MKKGQSLQDIAKTLETQLSSRKDYIASQGKVDAVVLTTPVMDVTNPKKQVGEKKEVAIDGLNGKGLTITDHAHSQLSAHLDIPKKYYDRMRAEEPELLAKNMNTWLHREAGKKRMIRTLDGKVRAFLSDRFRPLDNFDLAKVALPALVEARAEIVSAEVTDLRLYIKAIFPELSSELPEGLKYGEGHNFVGKDLVVASCTITNSEVGAGALGVDAGFFKTKCTNLAVFASGGMKKYHVGRSAVAELDSAVEYFTDATRQADDKAFWMKVRDIVRGSCNKDIFQAQFEKMKVATADRIESTDLPQVVEVTTKRLGLSEGLNNNILTHLIQGGDLTRWGLLNAITRTAEDQKSYDDATDLERAGGKVLELSPTDWSSIAAAK